jgi:hypothetical protein
MLICNKKKFVFIHVQKTGGRTIAHSMKKYMDESYPNYQPGRHVDMHKGCEFLKSKYPHTSNYFYFGFCRHPLNRFLSWFSALEQHKKSLAHITPLIYARNVLGEGGRTRQVSDTHSVFRKPPFIQAKVLKGADFVGRYESFSQDLDYVLDKFGIEDVDYGWVGKTDHSRWEKYYQEEELLSLVENYYSLDYKTFNYDLGAPK